MGVKNDRKILKYTIKWGRLWMSFLPDGYISLKNLYHEIGKRVFQDAWTEELEGNVFNANRQMLLFEYKLFEREGLKS